MGYSSDRAYKGQEQGKRDGRRWGERMRQQEPWRKGKSRQAENVHLKKEQIESLCLDRSTNSVFCIRQFQTPLFMYLGVVYGYTQTNTIINLSARALRNPHIKPWVIDLSLMVSAWGSKSKYN